MKLVSVCRKGSFLSPLTEGTNGYPHTVPIISKQKLVSRLSQHHRDLLHISESMLASSPLPPARMLPSPRILILHINQLFSLTMLSLFSIIFHSPSLEDIPDRVQSAGHAQSTPLCSGRCQISLPVLLSLQ